MALFEKSCHLHRVYIDFYEVKCRSQGRILKLLASRDGNWVTKKIRELCLETRLVYNNLFKNFGIELELNSCLLLDGFLSPIRQGLSILTQEP